MADRFEQLKAKYQSVLNFIQSQGVQLQNVNMEGDRLLIRATAPSAELKNKVWDQIKLVDPNFSDLIADIQAPAAAAAAAAGNAPSTTAARSYTVQAGDSFCACSGVNCVLPDPMSPASPAPDRSCVRVLGLTEDNR